MCLVFHIVDSKIEVTTSLIYSIPPPPAPLNRPHHKYHLPYGIHILCIEDCSGRFNSLLGYSLFCAHTVTTIHVTTRSLWSLMKASLIKRCSIRSQTIISLCYHLSSILRTQIDNSTKISTTSVMLWST